MDDNTITPAQVLRQLSQLIESNDKRYLDKFVYQERCLQKAVDNVWRNHNSDMMAQTEGIRVAFDASEKAVTKAEEYREKWRNNIQKEILDIKERVDSQIGTVRGHKESWAITIAVIMVILSFGGVYFSYSQHDVTTEHNSEILSQLQRDINLIYSVIEKHEMESQKLRTK